ncbi:hypothetical protein BH18ACT12_BH18ACT12_11180 [soil metagenome]
MSSTPGRSPRFSQGADYLLQNAVVMVDAKYMARTRVRPRDLNQRMPTSTFASLRELFRKRTGAPLVFQAYAAVSTAHEYAGTSL